MSCNATVIDSKVWRSGTGFDRTSGRVRSPFLLGSGRSPPLFFGSPGIPSLGGTPHPAVVGPGRTTPEKKPGPEAGLQNACVPPIFPSVCVFTMPTKLSTHGVKSSLQYNLPSQKYKSSHRPIHRWFLCPPAAWMVRSVNQLQNPPFTVIIGQSGFTESQPIIIIQKKTDHQKWGIPFFTNTR